MYIIILPNITLTLTRFVQPLHVGNWVGGMVGTRVGNGVGGRVGTIVGNGVGGRVGTIVCRLANAHNFILFKNFIHNNPTTSHSLYPILHSH